MFYKFAGYINNYSALVMWIDNSDFSNYCVTDRYIKKIQNRLTVKLLAFYILYLPLHIKKIFH